MRHRTSLLAVLTLATVGGACASDNDATTSTAPPTASATTASSVLHSKEELMGALLVVDDVAFIPGRPADLDASQNWVEAPTPPWENTLDPYLCTEAGTPSVLTLPQAQVELAGINLMEVLVSSVDSESLYNEFTAAYAKCDTNSTFPYEPLANAPTAGDASASYRCDRGLVTMARFGNDLMILRWMVTGDTDQAIPYYPQLVTTAANKVAALSG